MKIVCLKEYLIQPLIEAFPDISIVSHICQDAEIFIAEASQCSEENLKHMPNLRYIQSVRAGYDNADLKYMEQHNIIFANVRGLYSVPIAEDIINKILIYANHSLQYLEQKNKKIYQPIYHRTCLNKLCIGFLGTGSIAQETAKRLHAFECRIIGYKRKYVDELPYYDQIYYQDQLNEFLKQIDVLVVTVDLNKESVYMINEKTINMMKKGSAIINVARGSVICESDLIQALLDGRISYAGLDVFEDEPLQANSKLWELPMVYLTPHASGICDENHTRLFEFIKWNISQYLKDEMMENLILGRREM